MAIGISVRNTSEMKSHNNLFVFLHRSREKFAGRVQSAIMA